MLVTHNDTALTVVKYQHNTTQHYQSVEKVLKAVEVIKNGNLEWLLSGVKK